MMKHGLLESSHQKKWASRAIGAPDGAALEQDDTGNFTLAFLMRAPTEKESALAKSGTIKTACYVKAPFWMGILRFMDSPLSFKITFDITEYPEHERPSRIESIKNTGLTFIPLIDTDTGIVRSIRVAMLPAAFLDSLYLCASDLLSKDFSNQYIAWLNLTYQLPTDGLWLQSRETGTLGEESTPGQAEYDEAKEYFDKENFAAARKAFEQALSLGHPHAKEQLGLIVQIMGNADEGLRLIEEAAAEGSPYAMVELADWYFNGKRELRQDFQEGYRLMTRAYDTGHWFPASTLALYHTWALDYYPLDYDQAMQYAEEAEKRGALSAVYLVKSRIELEAQIEKKTKDVAQITKEFAANQIAAKKKHSKGQRIFVRGNVETVGRDDDGNMYVTLYSHVPNNWPIQNIKFIFEDKAADKLAKLTKMQRVRIFGEFSGHHGRLLYYEKSGISKIY